MNSHKVKQEVITMNRDKKSKTEIRKFWALIMMLDEIPRTQKNFVNELMFIGHYIELSLSKEDSQFTLDYDKYKTGNFELTPKQIKREKDNEGALSKAMSEILTKLENKKIVETSEIKTGKTGRNPDGYALLKNKKTLLGILKNIYDENNGIFYPEIRNHIMMTPYIKKILNISLINELEKDTKFKFTIEEKEIILNMLKNSCSALMYALKWAPKYGDTLSQYKLEFPSNYDEAIDEYKSDFIFNIQQKFGEDMGRTFGFVMGEVPFTYQTVIKFYPNNSSIDNYSESFINPSIENSVHKDALGIIHNTYTIINNKLTTGARIQLEKIDYNLKYSSIQNLFMLQFLITRNWLLLKTLCPFK